MAQTEDKFRKQLEVVKLKLDEIVEILASGNTEDISGTYEQIGELIKRLEKLKDTTADYVMETDKDLEYIKQSRQTMDNGSQRRHFTIQKSTRPNKGTVIIYVGGWGGGESWGGPLLFF